MMFTNKVYDVLKWIAQLFLPALAALYFALSKVWGFPYGAEVVGTISAIDAFLGALLGISSINYEGDGTIWISNDEKDEVELDLSSMMELKKGDKIVLKVEDSE